MTTLDLNFQQQPHTIAAFLIRTSQGLVLVETGPHSTYRNLEKAVRAAGFDIKEIRHVLLTHIHLDHAGAAWALAEHGATVYVHPFGSRHLNDPSRLMESARRIYQDDMDRLWGDMRGIPREKLRLVEDRQEIRIGERHFTAWHTPGHAVHHIAWQLDEVLFSGDVAGIKIANGPVVPPCPPPDINLEDWDNSLAVIRNINPGSIYLTHFGEITNISEHLNALRERLWDWANWIKPRWEAGETPASITPDFQNYVAGQLRQAGLNESMLEKYETANPAWMSVAGLIRYWKKRTAGS